MKIKKCLLTYILCAFAAYSNPGRDEFLYVNYQDLTDKSTVFNIPFRFTVPKNYVAISDFGNNQRHVVLHKSDLERVNANGGIIDNELFEYPFYYIEASVRYGFVNGKFTVEDRFGSERFKMKRIDLQNLPVLTVEPNEKENLAFKMILIHPNYETWVAHLHYFESRKHSDFSSEFWKKINEALLGRRNNESISVVPRDKIRPHFPDSAQFSGDIFRLGNNLLKPMPVPKRLPVIGKTTEKELNTMLPEDSITDRLTFLSPISWKKGGQKVVFDKFIEYEIVQDYKKDENSKLESYSRVGYWEFQVFLRKGVVVGYNLLHMSVGPSKQYEPDSKSITKTVIVGDKRALESAYLEQRHPLFRQAQKR